MKTSSTPARFLVVLALMVGIAAHGGHAAEPRLYALTNAKNPTKAISSAQVKSLFLGSTSFWNGVVPVRLYARPDAQVTGFFQGLLGTTPQGFQQHWTTRQLSGLGTSPEVVDDVAQLCGRVKSAPGALSIVSEAEAALARSQPGVKVIPIDG